MKYSIIFPTYDRVKTLEKCIEHNINKAGIPRSLFEVIWIDDGSKEVDLVEKVMSKVNPEIIVKKQYNEGTIKTKNLGMYLAKGDYLLIIDTDFILTENWLKEIDVYLSKLYIDVILLSDHFRDKWEGINFKVADLSLAQLTSNIVSGAFLISREVLETVGFLDKAFGFYGLNDADWTFRLRRAKYEPYYLGNVYAKHLGVRGESGDNRDKKEKSLKENAALLRKRIKGDLIYYNPTLNACQNMIMDLEIKENLKRRKDE